MSDDNNSVLSYTHLGRETGAMPIGMWRPETPCRVIGRIHEESACPSPTGSGNKASMEHLKEEGDQSRGGDKLKEPADTDQGRLLCSFVVLFIIT